MDKEALYRKMEEAGYSIRDMYEALGISRSAFYRKCNGLSEFTLGEILKMMALLKVKDPYTIFFNGKVS